MCAQIHRVRLTCFHPPRRDNPRPSIKVELVPPGAGDFLSAGPRQRQQAQRGFCQYVGVLGIVDCSEEGQVSRVMARSRLSADEVRAIMATQASRAARLAAADDVVLNDDGLDSLQVWVPRKRSGGARPAPTSDTEDGIWLWVPRGHTHVNRDPGRARP